MCRAVEDRFELEPIVEERIANSSLDTDYFYPLSRGTIGLYRIIGVKPVDN